MCDKNNNTNDIIGYTGGIVLSICLLPQIIQIYKTKHVFPSLERMSTMSCLFKMKKMYLDII